MKLIALPRVWAMPSQWCTDPVRGNPAHGEIKLGLVRYLPFLGTCQRSGATNLMEGVCGVGVS